MTGHYKSNVRDLLFNLLEWSQTREHLRTGVFGDFDPSTVRDVLAEVATLAEGPVAESFVAADREPPVFNPATGSITLPDALHRVVRHPHRGPGSLCTAAARGRGDGGRND